ncbi:chorismate mutase [Siccirubricoccus phaeus]|uniref:chorismate mutase n=1 Tax=Siccirubricoccus phaeus TaxID=2595053 RepID=UPI00165AFD4A|nr:chorismate mutase [Siccirubricoccus phaeus]
MPGPETMLAELRAEIDALDSALHDLIMRRAEVVARLAASGIKAGRQASPLRPGREAMILRRLLSRHHGPLPRLALVRLWREILAGSSAMQGGFAVAVPAAGVELSRLAREHFGTPTPLRSVETATRALAAVTEGEAQVAVLPLPEEGEAPEATWWTRLEVPRLQVVARLPFYAPKAEGLPEALAVTQGRADPSGADRTLLRLELAEDRGRGALAAALAAAGLPPRLMLLHRIGGVVLALAEVEGMLAADDPRLLALSFARAQILGAYAAPERGE